jgi:serine/threonine protein kinase
MKPANILIAPDGTLKLADFGLSRSVSVAIRPYSHEVVTLWYRCPELLLGANEYSKSVDIWSVGCIFFELIRLRPLFEANDEISMLKIIFNTLGSPDETTWPGYSQLPSVRRGIKCPVTASEGDLREKFHISKNLLDDSGYDLMMKMLRYAPEERIKAEEALRHPYLA